MESISDFQLCHDPKETREHTHRVLSPERTRSLHLHLVVLVVVVVAINIDVDVVD